MATEGTNPEITGTGTAVEIEISDRNGKIKEATAIITTKIIIKSPKFES